MNGSKHIRADVSIGPNAALDGDLYLMPIHGDHFKNLHKGARFTKLDVTEAYYQREMTWESQSFLTKTVRKLPWPLLIHSVTI